MRIETIGDATLYLGDCRDILPTLPKVDAVITDPPYGKVKGDFDHAWTSRSAMLKDAAEWADAIVGCMKPNATLWWFAWPSLAGRIEAMLAERLNVLAHVVWEKPNAHGQKCRKEALRAPMPLTERIIMAEHYGADRGALGESGYERKCDEARGFIFEPLRAYLAQEMENAGHNTATVNAAWRKWKGGNGGMASHWFTDSQWSLPTRENYLWLRKLFNDGDVDEHLRKDYEHLRKDYEELRKDYEELRKDYEELRRWYDCRPGDQYSDIWRFPGERVSDLHPTQKPVRIMEHIVRLSVRTGGVCVDPFMGSGTTGVACMNLGRAFIGIEREPKYFDIACRRIEDAQRQGRLFT